jgi:hypothetical protein
VIRLGQLAAVWLTMAGLAVGAQWLTGAYRAEWTFHPDEPAHQVSGLMVHDYLALAGHGVLASPKKFAENFYQHYPKVAIGHWPPGFYLMQGIWLLLVPASRASLLVLMALISASVLTFCYAVLVRRYPWWMALGSVVWMATVPLYQQFSRSIMPELAGCLVMLGATVALAGQLEKPGWRNAALFALSAAAAILTRLTTIGLALLPVAAVYFLRRRKLLRNKAFWYPAMIVAAMCLPWFLAAPGALHSRVAFLGGLRPRWYRPLESIYHWARYFGPVGSGLIALGAARIIRDWRLQRPIDMFEALLFLSFPVVMLWRSLIGAWDHAYLVSTLPLALPMLCSGFEWLMNAFRAQQRQAYSFAAVLFAAGVWWNMVHTSPKAHLGLDAITARLTEESGPRQTFLIVSDSIGEGVFVAEIALRDQRPGRTVLRGSKVLADEGWMESNADRNRFASAGQMRAYVEALPQPILVLDEAAAPSPYARMLEKATAQNPDWWEEIPWNGSAGGRKVRILRRRH